MRRLVIVLLAAGLLSVGALASTPARASGVVDEILSALGLGSSATPSPTGPATDFRNCDTGECD